MDPHPDQPHRGVQLRPSPSPSATPGEIAVFSRGGYRIASLRHLAEGDCQIAVDVPDLVPVANAEWEITIEDGPGEPRGTHVLFRAWPLGDRPPAGVADVAPWASLVTQAIECNRG